MNNASDLLISLIDNCKCSVNLTINLHRDYHQSVEERINELLETGVIDEEDKKDLIEGGILSEMIKKNTIIDLHFYPHTGIGSYKIIHHDLLEALKEAVKLIPDDSFYPDDETMINVIKKAQELDEAGE